MYQEIGEISESTLVELKNILKDAKWEVHVSEVTSHQASPCTGLPNELKSIGKWDRALFLRLGAGGKLYRHHDEGFGFHIPVETNDDCVSLSYENGRKEHHLEVGKIYHCDRSIEHESLNNGATNRTHLILL